MSTDPPSSPAPDPDGWEPTPGIDGPAEIHALDDVDLLAELNHPTRSRILRAMKQPRTVAEVADLLDMPVTRLYHHVNRLESLGFIRVVATRRVAAVTERRYQVAARSWQVDRALFESTDPRDLAIALGSLFDVAKLAFQREVEAGNYAAIDDPEHHSFLSRGQIVVSTARRNELMERLTQLVEEFQSDTDEDDPDAHRIEVFIAAFPETT